MQKKRQRSSLLCEGIYPSSMPVYFVILYETKHIKTSPQDYNNTAVYVLYCILCTRTLYSNPTSVSPLLQDKGDAWKIPCQILKL